MAHALHRHDGGGDSGAPTGGKGLLLLGRRSHRLHHRDAPRGQRDMLSELGRHEAGDGLPLRRRGRHGWNNQGVDLLSSGFNRRSTDPKMPAAETVSSSMLFFLSSHRTGCDAMRFDARVFRSQREKVGERKHDPSCATDLVVFTSALHQSRFTDMPYLLLSRAPAPPSRVLVMWWALTSFSVSLMLSV